MDEFFLFWVTIPILQRFLLRCQNCSHPFLLFPTSSISKIDDNSIIGFEGELFQPLKSDVISYQTHRSSHVSNVPLPHIFPLKRTGSSVRPFSLTFPLNAFNSCIWDLSAQNCVSRGSFNKKIHMLLRCSLHCYHLHSHLFPLYYCLLLEH